MVVIGVYVTRMVHIIISVVSCMSSEWSLPLPVVFIVIHSLKRFLLLLVVFIARHVTQMVYKRWKAKSSCGQWNWKHFSWQPREGRVAFIPHDLFTIVEVCTVMRTTQFCNWNACSQCTNKHTQITHVRRTVSTVAQRSNSKVWVNIEWTY